MIYSTDVISGGKSNIMDLLNLGFKLKPIEKCKDKREKSFEFVLEINFSSTCIVCFCISDKEL